MLAATPTVIPQIGSTASAAGDAPAALAAPVASASVPAWASRARRTSTILARIESATSAGVRAPMSSPAGVSIPGHQLRLVHAVGA